MQIKVTVPDAFVALVQSRGLDAESYAQELMDQEVARDSAKTDERREAVESMLRFANEYDFTLGTGDLKNTLHEGHKH